jgi:hypothetical protein
VASLAEGQVSGAIEAEGVLRIVKVLRVTPERPRGFDEVKDEAVALALEEKQKAAVGRWVEKLRAVAAVKLNDRAIRSYEKERAAWLKREEEQVAAKTAADAARAEALSARAKALPGPAKPAEAPGAPAGDAPATAPAAEPAAADRAAAPAATEVPASAASQGALAPATPAPALAAPAVPAAPAPSIPASPASRP